MDIGRVLLLAYFGWWIWALGSTIWEDPGLLVPWALVGLGVWYAFKVAEARERQDRR